LSLSLTQQKGAQKEREFEYKSESVTQQQGTQKEREFEYKRELVDGMQVWEV
jgi:hypothetical protein